MQLADHIKVTCQSVIKIAVGMGEEVSHEVSKGRGPMCTVIRRRGLLRDSDGAEELTLEAKTTCFLLRSSPRVPWTV